MKFLNYIIKSIKNFFFYEIEKELLFIKSIDTFNQLILFYYIICILLLFYLDLVKYKVFLSFLLLWILILTYKIILDIISYYSNNNENLKKYIKENEKKVENILYILLFIQKWKNPLLILLLYMDNFFLKILKIVIYKLKNNKWFSYTKSNFKVFLNVQNIIFSILVGPLKLILGFYYSMLFRLSEMPFSLFLLIRSFGFVLNILIISHIYKFLYNIFGLKIYIYIYIYLIFFSFFIKIIDKDFKYLKLSFFNTFHSIDRLNFFRNFSTICGLIIFFIILYKEKKISIQYIGITSAHLKMFIEENFDKYWVYYEKNYLLCTINIWREIKNRPSWYVYQTFIYWINMPGSYYVNNPSFIIELLYIRYKSEQLKLDLPQEIKNNINYLYKIDLIRLKLILFMLWDIDSYIGNNHYNYITYKLDKPLFNIGCDSNIYNYNDLNNFKIEQNKDDLIFYNTESNMYFFNKLHKVMGTPPYLENPLKTKISSDFFKTYIEIKKGLLDDLIIFYNDGPFDNTWIRWAEDYEMDENEIPKIEYRIKDWIINFLKEERKEWELLLKKESIEERNWRLLKEIEELLLRKIKKNENK